MVFPSLLKIGRLSRTLFYILVSSFPNGERPILENFNATPVISRILGLVGRLFAKDL